MLRWLGGVYGNPVRAAALLAVLACAAGTAGAGEVPASEPGAALELPEALAKAPVHTWTMLDAGGYGARNSVGLVYLPDERSFVVLGGAAGKAGAYSEVTLNLKASRWENRFPVGMEGKWGEPTGPSQAPAFNPYSAFKDLEGNVRPNLAYGYNSRMELWGNAAYDAARGKVVVPFHRLSQTWEYDPKTRVWSHLASADGAPYAFWDDLVFNSMCYDPVNREVLAGACRWALRNGKWEEQVFGGALVNELRGKAEVLARRVRHLTGACRARYYVTENAAMAAVKLEDTCAALAKEIAAFASEASGAAGKAGAYEKQQLGWAAEDLKRALEHLGKAQGLLASRVTPEGIAAAEDAWEALDDVLEDLAAHPPKRAYARPAVDERRGKMLLFGGHRLDRITSDTWVYDCKTRTWEQRRPALSPPPRYGHGLVWLPQSGKFVLVDGAGRAELWSYDLEADAWSLLDEGGAKRESLTSIASTWGWQPEMSAAGPGDVVVTLSNHNESKLPRFSTWAARIDVSKVDAAGTQQKGVPFRTEAFEGGPTADPRWYEQKAGAVETAEQQAWIDGLPANAWVTREKASQQNNPNDNRAWGTVIYDPERDQFLHWGGGHVAYVGNSVLHYSLRTNRFYIGHRPEFGLVYAAGQGGMKNSTSYRNRAFMTGHSYHSYGYDRRSDKAVFCGQTLAEGTVKASLYFAYDPAGGEWLPGPLATPWEAHYGFDRLYPEPEGLLAWASGEFWRPDVAKRAWEKQPRTGAKLPNPSHEGHGMAYDTKRGRMLLFAGTYVAAYDSKSGEVKALEPQGLNSGHKFQCRELVYLPDWDAVLVASRVPDSDGKLRWLLYDCAKNAWHAVLLGGAEITGKTYNVALGLVYDSKRKLVWGVDNTATVSALRPDLKTADVRVLEAAVPEAKK